MTPEIVTKVQPLSGKIVSASDFITQKSTSKSRREGVKATRDMNKEHESMKEATSMLPDMESNPDSVIRFTPVPENWFPPGSTPQEVTKYSMDSTYAIQTMIKTINTNGTDALLGELQFSFICFIIGQVLDSFEQWKQLLHLLCCGEGAVSKYKDLYISLIKVLHFQLREVPEDFFVDIVSQNNFLTSTLRELFSNLQNESVDKTLCHRGMNFKQNLTTRFNWDFDVEADEDGPVVVELSDN